VLGAGLPCEPGGDFAGSLGLVRSCGRLVLLDDGDQDAAAVLDLDGPPPDPLAHLGSVDDATAAPPAVRALGRAAGPPGVWRYRSIRAGPPNLFDRP